MQSVGNTFIDIDGVERPISRNSFQKIPPNKRTGNYYLGYDFEDFDVPKWRYYVVVLHLGINDFKDKETFTEFYGPYEDKLEARKEKRKHTHSVIFKAYNAMAIGK